MSHHCLEPLHPANFPENEYLKENQALYNGCRFVFEGTTFLLFERKDGNIGTERLIRAVSEAWPKWMSYFPVNSPPITILETDWGLGGGSLGPFTIAIHLRDSYDPSSSEYLKPVLGWEPASTGIDYIKREFANKALVFLTELRLQIGGVKFDTYVREYLSRPI